MAATYHQQQGNASQERLRHLFIQWKNACQHRLKTLLHNGGNNSQF
jgi:hypothetical protein